MIIPHPALLIDNFAGGGGASTGIEQALNRPVDYSINHDQAAVVMHTANHPRTIHLCEDVWAVSPRDLIHGRPVDLAWFSPDCKHFSKAKGGKPVSKKIRGLAWVAVRWAKEAQPRIIILENVEEFQDWGPIDPITNLPIPEKKGITFRRFLGLLRAQGYQIDHRLLTAADYGAPTTRKRFFLIARRDGAPIEWPAPTHRNPQAPTDLFTADLPPWRTAAECIDWTIPCPSIFDRARPLAEATLARIAAGIRRFVAQDGKPFLVGIDNKSSGPSAIWPLSEPLRTIVLENRFALVIPTLISTGYGERDGQAPRVPGLDKPLGTIVATQKHALVAAFLISYYGNSHDAHAINHPTPTITTRDRFGLVEIRGEQYKIADIGLRMLTPRELATAQGFPPDYILTGTKTNQVARIGNSVCPPVAAALVRANLPSQRAEAVA